MDRSYAAVHIEEDRRHWYFRGRLQVLAAVLQATLPSAPCRLVELGCGTGNVLQTLGRFGQVVGIEHDDALREVATTLGLDARAGTLPDAIPIPDAWADAVLLLDVMEHVADDLGCLRTARRLLRAGGLLVVTVPAYPWLWTAHDEVLGHRRRYTAAMLGRRLEEAGFDVERLSYFNSVLFPAIAGVRIVKRLLGLGGHDLRRPPEPLNRVLTLLFALERHVVLRPGLPFGCSVLGVARA